MRIAGPDHRLRGQVRIATVLAAGAILLGCSGTGSYVPSLPSISGSLPGWFRTSPAAQAKAEASAPQMSLEEDCPSIDIRTGAGTLAVAAKTNQPTANDLRYQLSFNELARQCFVDGGSVRMRVGVQGRAVVGPA